MFRFVLYASLSPAGADLIEAPMRTSPDESHRPVTLNFKEADLIDVRDPNVSRGSADLAGDHPHAEQAPSQSSLAGGDRESADPLALKPIVARIEAGEFDAEILPTLRYFRSFQRHPLQRRPQ
jgi:hypothetical protein